MPVFNGNMQRIDNRETKGQKLNESEGKSTAKEAKVKPDDDTEAAEAGDKEKRTRKKQSNSI